MNDHRAKGASTPVARPRTGRAGALALCAAWLAGCQTYEPRPLDPVEHREAWHGRTLEDSSLESFLERLDRTPDDRAPEFDPANGLTVREGQLVALVFNPGLRLARLRVGRAAASAEYAGLWNDPELALSVLKVTDGVPDPWVITPALTFSLPISGRLAVERDQADAAQRAAEQRAREAEWQVWNEVRRAWVDWSAAQLRVEETERLIVALESLVETAAQLAEAGELASTGASLLAVEKAQRENALRRMHGDVEVEEQRLRALMGLSPEAPVTLVPTLVVANERPAAAGGPDEIAERNPALVRLGDEYDVAEQTLRHEIRKQYPDLVLGPQFETDQGQSRIGFLGALPIPLWNANRRAIAEARASREIARAALETQYEVLVGRWSVATARAEALDAQRADMEAVLVPLVDRQLEATLRLIQLGEGTALVLLESLTRAQQTKLDLIDTRRAEALVRIELEHLTGPLAHAGADEEKTETP